MAKASVSPLPLPRTPGRENKTRMGHVLVVKLLQRLAGAGLWEDTHGGLWEGEGADAADPPQGRGRGHCSAARSTRGITLYVHWEHQGPHHSLSWRAILCARCWQPCPSPPKAVVIKNVPWGVALMPSAKNGSYVSGLCCRAAGQDSACDVGFPHQSPGRVLAVPLLIHIPVNAPPLPPT